MFIRLLNFIFIIEYSSKKYTFPINIKFKIKRKGRKREKSKYKISDFFFWCNTLHFIYRKVTNTTILEIVTI